MCICFFGIRPALERTEGARVATGVDVAATMKKLAFGHFLFFGWSPLSVVLCPKGHINIWILQTMVSGMGPQDQNPGSLCQGGLLEHCHQ